MVHAWASRCAQVGAKRFNLLIFIRAPHTSIPGFAFVHEIAV
jgi:hypothetical protein